MGIKPAASCFWRAAEILIVIRRIYEAAYPFWVFPAVNPHCRFEMAVVLEVKRMNVLVITVIRWVRCDGCLGLIMDDNLIRQKP